MKGLLFFAHIATIFVFFNACVDVNLRSEMPQIAYYKLDLAEFDSKKSCAKFDEIGLSNIEVPAQYRQNKTFYIKDEMINYISSANFVPSIAQSMENMLIKKANNNCTHVILAPFSGLNLNNFLSVKLLDFYIDLDSNEAVVSLAYRVNSGKKLTNDFISLRTELKDSSIESALKTLTQTMQEAMDLLISSAIKGER